VELSAINSFNPSQTVMLNFVCDFLLLTGCWDNLVVHLCVLVVTSVFILMKRRILLERNGTKAALLAV